MDLWLAIVLIVAFCVIGFVLGMTYRKKVAEREISSAEDEAKRIINDAIKSAESKNVKLSSRQRKKYTKVARSSSARKRHAVPTCKSRREDFSRRKKTLTARQTLLSARTKLLHAR